MPNFPEEPRGFLLEGFGVTTAARAARLRCSRGFFAASCAALFRCAHLRATRGAGVALREGGGDALE